MRRRSVAAAAAVAVAACVADVASAESIGSSLPFVLLIGPRVQRCSPRCQCIVWSHINEPRIVIHRANVRAAGGGGRPRRRTLPSEPRSMHFLACMLAAAASSCLVSSQRALSAALRGISQDFRQRMLTSSPAFHRHSSAANANANASMYLGAAGSTPLGRRPGSPFKPDTLYRAVTKGDDETVVQQLADNWLEPSILNEALARACAAGHVAIAQALMLYGAAVQPAKPPPSSTPLLCACEAGHQQLVLHLLQRGAHINGTAAEGDAPLSRSAFCGRATIVELLIERRASLDASNQGGALGHVTPLERAIAGSKADQQQSRSDAQGDCTACVELLKAAETARTRERTRAAWRAIKNLVRVRPHADDWIKQYAQGLRAQEAQRLAQATSADEVIAAAPAAAAPADAPTPSPPSPPVPALPALSPAAAASASEPAPAAAAAAAAAPAGSGGLGMSLFLTSGEMAQQRTAKSGAGTPAAATPLSGERARGEVERLHAAAAYTGPPVPKLDLSPPPSEPEDHSNLDDDLGRISEGEDEGEEEGNARKREVMAPSAAVDFDEVDFDEAETPRAAVSPVGALDLASLPLGHGLDDDDADDDFDVDDEQCSVGGGSSSGIE